MDDRLCIDKARQKEIRAIKDNGYLEFNNQVDVFLTAMAYGMDMYMGTPPNFFREAFILSTYLNDMDNALLYAMVYDHLKDIEDISNRAEVYQLAEGMADKGFTIMLDEMKSVSAEVYSLKMLQKTNDLYKEALDKGYFDM